MQQKIIICRHAESLEDIDNNIYDLLNDLDIPLTEKGIIQSKSFGGQLPLIIDTTTTVKFFTSPGLRNRQTLDHIIPMMPSSLDYSVEVEPLIVKQDWGNITSFNRAGIEEERYRTGVLRYCFPTGERATAMMQRLSHFKNKIIDLQSSQPCNIVILSHGFEFRVLLMLILGWEEEYFESLANLNNCEYRILFKQDNGEYSLNKPLKCHGLPITRLQSQFHI